MFQCPNCSKEFTQQTQLTDHEWEHSPPDSSSKQVIKYIREFIDQLGEGI